MGMNSAVVRMAAFAAFAVVVSAAEAAEAKRSFGTVPKQALVELKATVGKPFSSGLVFIDGKFIPPPYKVERFGTAFRINGNQVTRQVIPWDEFLKTQPGVRIEQVEIAPSAPAESEAPEPAAEETAEPAADTPTAETPASTETTGEKKSGCGSFIGGGLIVLVTVLGSAWAAKRR